MRNDLGIMGWLSGLLLILIVGGLIFVTTLKYGNEKTEVINITSAEIQIKNSSEGGIKRDKLVFTSEDIYSVEDRFWSWHFTSMGVFNKLKQNIGKDCEVTTVGTRIGFFNMYRNVTDVNNCK